MQGKQKALAINSGMSPPPPPPPQNAGRWVDHILGFTTPMYFYYLWDESVSLPTRLTVPCLGWRAGLISLNVGAGNRPTFQCSHPLTDKEAAPLLPASAADSDAVSPWRLRSTEGLVPVRQTLSLTLPYLQVDCHSHNIHSDRWQWNSIEATVCGTSW